MMTPQTPQPPQPARPPMMARFAGTCSNCGDRFAPGTPIYWAKGIGGRHAVCPGILPAPVAVAPKPQAAAPKPQAAAPKPQAAPALPTFDARDPREGWTAYGRRALLFVLSTDLTYCLDDAGLEAAADAVSHVQASGVSAEALDRLTEMQARLRGLLRGRKAAEALAAAQVDAVAQDGPPAAQAAPGDANGGEGGSKVPRPVAPRPKGPQAGKVTPRPAAQAPAGLAPRMPQPVAVGGDLNDDDAF